MSTTDKRTAGSFESRTLSRTGRPGLGGRVTGLPWRRVAVLLVVAFLAVSLVTVLRSGDDRTYTAYFATSQGVYEGDEVRILGVRVGTITDITPTDLGARIRFTLDDDVRVPAGAKAAIVAPSLVSSRYVQLTPQYAGGAELDADTAIPLDRTAVPVEFDELKGELDELATVLGPDGVNRDGSLSGFVSTTAETLEGKGADINETISALAQTITLLDTGRNDIFGTVRNLQQFVSVLAASDQQIREFGDRLDAVATILAENRTSLRRGMRTLSTTVGEVETFVGDNRQRIVSLTKQLGDTLLTVADNRDAVEQILHVGPNALRNFYATYHSKENSIAAGMMSANTRNLRQLVCGALGGIGSAGQNSATACVQLLGPLLDAASGDLLLSTDVLAQLEQALGLDLGGQP